MSIIVKLFGVVDFDPDQSSLAQQDVAPVDDQLTVPVPPYGKGDVELVTGLEEIFTIGAPHGSVLQD